MSRAQADSDQLILDAIAGHKPNSKGRVRANCPLCPMVAGKVDRKQCLELNTNGGWWKCYRCGSDGRLDDMPFDLATAATAPSAGPEKPPVNYPEGFVPLWTPEGQAAISLEGARKYLAKRGIPLDVIAAARIGACVRGFFAGRIVVPIYQGGKLTGYVGRLWKKRIGPDDRKYMYNSGFERATTLYNEEALYITTDEPVIVVEGVFDTFPFFRPGESRSDAVAVLGKESEAQVTMMLNARRPIAVVFDGDAYRQGTVLATFLRIHGKKAISLRLPPGVDPDEVPAHVRAKARAAFTEEAHHVE